MENWTWVLTATAAALGLAWIVGGPPQVSVQVPGPVVQRVAEEVAPAIEGVQAAALLLQEEAKAIERSNEAVRRMADFVTAAVVAAVLLLILSGLLMYRQVSHLSSLIDRWLEIEENRFAHLHDLLERVAHSRPAPVDSDLKPTNGHRVR
jgi:hypothetical protein